MFPEPLLGKEGSGAVIIGYPATESGLPNRNLTAQKGSEITWID